jgi:hypothetical protein
LGGCGGGDKSLISTRLCEIAHLPPDEAAKAILSPELLDGT